MLMFIIIDVQFIPVGVSMTSIQLKIDSAHKCLIIHNCRLVPLET